jgi:hypothetical protein
MSRLSAALALLIALAGVASAQPRDPAPQDVITSDTPPVDYSAAAPPEPPAVAPDEPQIILVTMGIGSLIWERHGHIALCVEYRDPRKNACYNYGIGDFHEPLKMVWGFFRGTHSFWVGKMVPGEMLAIYKNADRTIWVQVLPLEHDQKVKIIDKLEHDILDDNKYYAYDHFDDNCTTRIRDIIDDATGGTLKSMTDDPTDGKTFRDLAREGFFGMPDNSRLSLLITDIAMGRSTDKVPDYWERMFLPQFLREAVAKKFGVQPIARYTRSECRQAGDATAEEKTNCAERGVRVPSEGPSGRFLFALFALAITAPVVLARRYGRFQRASLALAIAPYALLGLILWVLAIISPLPYVRWNESLLVFLPADLLLLFLRPELRVRYAKVRVGMLALLAVLMIVGLLKQPLMAELLWPLVPAAVVGFWPEAWTKSKPAARTRNVPPTRKHRV